MNNKTDAETILNFTRAACLTILCQIYDKEEDLIKAIRFHYANNTKRIKDVPLTANEKSG